MDECRIDTYPHHEYGMHPRGPASIWVNLW